MSVIILTDSTADLPAADRARVTVLPLTILFGDQAYVDGVDIDTLGFYEKLETSPVVPTTSQASPFAFEEAFREAVDRGDEVVCITCSSKLSGTYQSAVIASEEFPGKVFLVDSRSIALGSSLLVRHALTLRDNGLDARTIAEALLEKRHQIRLIAMLDTLEYLKKGGRISAAVAFAGGLLNVKPMVALEDGEIKMAGTARSGKQVWAQLDKLVEAKGGVDTAMPVQVGYTGKEDTRLTQYLHSSALSWEDAPRTTVGSVVGAHAGPGAVALAFFARDGSK